MKEAEDKSRSALDMDESKDLQLRKKPVRSKKFERFIWGILIYCVNYWWVNINCGSVKAYYI